MSGRSPKLLTAALAMRRSADQHGTMGVPRKHHYVPKTLLAGFTRGGRADESLNVLDKHSGCQWASSPEKTACARDFYALDVAEDSEHDALAIETYFSKVESNARDSIQAMLHDGAVPGGDLRHRLMEFLAIQAVRVPGIRQSFNASCDQMMKTVAWYMVATPESWARVQEMRDAGEPLPGVPYERMREFVQSGQFDVSWDQNTHLTTILQPIPALTAAFNERTWTLVASASECPDFVCSDRPLTVSWNNPAAPRWMPPGLGHAGTTVQIPISRRAALIGMYEGPFPMKVATTRLVGIVNMCTVFHSTRYVYSVDPEFYVVLPDGTPGNRASVIQHAASQQRRRSAGPDDTHDSRANS